MTLTWDRALQREVQDAVILAQASGSVPSAMALKVRGGRLEVTEHELAAVVAASAMLGDLRMDGSRVHATAPGHRAR